MSCRCWKIRMPRIRISGAKIAMRITQTREGKTTTTTKCTWKICFVIKLKKKNCLGSAYIKLHCIVVTISVGSLVQHGYDAQRIADRHVTHRGHINKRHNERNHPDARCYDWFELHIENGVKTTENISLGITEDFKIDSFHVLSVVRQQFEEQKQMTGRWYAQIGFWIKYFVSII